MWQEYTEQLCKRNLNDPDNQHDVITHLEEDILRWEVKWAFGSITTNKPSGSDGILVEVFQILKYNAIKVLHLICTQFSSGSAMSNSLQPHGLQHSGFPVHCQLPEFTQTHAPLSW